MNVMLKNKEFHVGCLAFFTIGMAVNIIFSLLPDIRATFELSYAEAGNVMVVLQIGFIISLIARTKLLECLKMKKLLLVAVGVWLTGIGFIILSSDKYFLYAGIAFSGFSYGTFQNLLSAYIVMASENHTGKRVSLMNAFFGIGSITAPVMASLALVIGNWRFGYVPIVILVFILLSMVRNIQFLPVFETENNTKESFPFGLTFICISLFVLVYPMTEFTAGSWFSEYWHVLGDENIVPYSMVTAFFWLSFTIGRLIAGKIADHIGNMPFMLHTTLFFMLISAIWLKTDHPIIALLSLIGIGLALAGMFPIFLIQAGEFFPKHVGTITSWFYFFLSVGGMTSQKFVGEMAEIYGISVLPLIFFGSSIFLMIVLLFLSKERRRMIQEKGSADSPNWDSYD
ncbi:MFS transporter [Tindallia californiensis]|uniref:Fucose permease n=1 Tax=Tindallia californiensis TaxID=159292 RepID=A0A1H3IM59_9FIRM|nr:MFS transporter [Tindallia californiensis]SDY28772.1 Fucose permease [Tindallia californiensis]